jgi:CheY-like chemotaxis protein
MSATQTVVLVVEDEAIIRMDVVGLLVGAGFEVLDAKSADHAIAILETRPDIRLVFTDVDMPGTMDGIRLAHHVRDRWPAVLLIVASGKMVVELALLPGGTRFFRKPYSDDVLVEAMTGMLAANDAAPRSLAR